jgi:hypothetical protein
MLPTPNEEQKQELQALLTDRKGNVAYITDGTDRIGVARRIRAHLGNV